MCEFAVSCSKPCHNYSAFLFMLLVGIVWKKSSVISCVSCVSFFWRCSIFRSMIAFRHGVILQRGPDKGFAWRMIIYYHKFRAILVCIRKLYIRLYTYGSVEICQKKLVAKISLMLNFKVKFLVKYFFYYSLIALSNFGYFFSKKFILSLKQEINRRR